MMSPAKQREGASIHTDPLLVPLKGLRYPLKRYGEQLQRPGVAFLRELYNDNGKRR